MDADALAKVFDLYAPAIYKYAFRHCDNAIMADQIVGDVFEMLLDQLALGKGPTSNLRSYLFEIAYHTMVNEIRYSRRTASLDVAEYIVSDANYTDLNAEEQTLSEMVFRAIQRELTQDQRDVIILRFLEAFSLKETALIMGKTVANIKVIQNRAVAVLRKALDDQTT